MQQQEPDPWLRWLTQDRFAAADPATRQSVLAWLDSVRTRVLQAAELRPGQSVLEIGCGQGEMLGALLDAVGEQGQVIGLDVSPGLLRQSEQRMADHPLVSRLRLIQGDLTRAGDLGEVLPQLDAIVSRSVLQHLGDGLRPALRLLRGRLGPGGRLSAFETTAGDDPLWLPPPSDPLQRQAVEKARLRGQALLRACTQQSLWLGLREAGFASLECSQSRTFRYGPASPDQYRAYLRVVPPASDGDMEAVLTGELTPAERQAFDAAVAAVRSSDASGSYCFILARA